MENLFSLMVEAVEKLRSYGKDKPILIIHHDDADGLCSAAIIKKALEREGFQAKTICLEKLFPEVIKSLHREEGKIYVYTDIGSAHATKISEENKSKNLTIILDHHDFTPSKDPMVYNLNPEVFGVSGEREASGATVSYFFAKRLNRQNMDLAHLAIIGSAEIPGVLSGLNREALKDALKQKLIEVSRSRFGEDYKILRLGKPQSYKRFSTMFSILGSVGYYTGGPEKGIKACLEGLDEETENLIAKLEEKRRKANQKMMERLRGEGLNQLKNVQWFHAYDNFRDMGTKVIGSFCSYLSFQQKIVNPEKYVVGIMYMQPNIPNFGSLNMNYVKVSARTPKRLGLLVEKGGKPPLSKILPEACEKFGGFGDGHSVAASGVFLRGEEKNFVKVFDGLAEGLG
ncbi:MAG: hypothetical protein DRO36_04645 [Candidatus Hecatellales archaeon]|nr:MAG: hypothetical protein DRO36_04645 [Candidatus Hecatellales archaeon]